MISFDQYPQTLRDKFGNELLTYAGRKRLETISAGYVEDLNFDQYIFVDTCHVFTLRALADAEKSMQKGQAFGADATYQEQAAMWKAALDQLSQARTSYLSMMVKTNSTNSEFTAWQQI